jgi:hypothetical protein
MKIKLIRGARARRLFFAGALVVAALNSAAQATPAAPQDEPHHGTVIFSRSTD